MTSRYDAAYRRSLQDPEGFWAEAAAAIDWDKRWDRVLDTGPTPVGRWFSGGRLNTCHNALDRHVAAGRADQAALIYDSPVTGTIKSFSYRELRDLVARFAGVLRRLGIGKGDRVLIYMPMIPEAAIAMLAAARIGAIHSVVFGGFAANELKTRIDDAKPKVIVAGSCGIEPAGVVAYKPLLDAAIEAATFRPAHCVIVQRPQGPAALVAGRDRDWHEEMAKADAVECLPVAATDPLYILYTSGTTGAPKGIVRDNGGHAVALTWSMRYVYGIEPGEVFWAASDVGWVVGHSYIIYAPLLYGATGIIFEGKPVGTPDPGAYWRIVQQHKVVTLFTAPTAFRALKRDDPNGEFIRKHDLSGFRSLFLAGERADPDTVQWAERMLKRPVIDHWWQTESGWPMVANCAGFGLDKVKHGSASRPVPGYDLRVVDEGAHPVKAGTVGALVVKLPLPPGFAPTLWGNEAGFRKAYLEEFPGYYKTADAGFQDEDGYVSIMSRTDDVINVAGHRLSTGAMEEVLAAHPGVAECAVIGVADALKGQIPVGLMVLKSGVSRPGAEVVAEVVKMVRERIGPVAAFKQAVVVKRLPKTRSGKVLRATMRKIADGETYKMPATIDDPVILSEIGESLATLGYPASDASRPEK